MSAADLALTLAYFPTAKPKGPAIGDPIETTWREFSDRLSSYRREGAKDGPGFIPVRFKLEDDHTHVRRLGANLIARTAIALDIETNHKTGEIPPSPDETATLVRKEGWAAVIYTSHSHSPDAPRCRIVIPLPQEIDYELPVVDVVADRLGLSGVLDRSKVGANSLFYLPSTAPGKRKVHQALVIEGRPVDAAGVSKAAAKLLAEHQAEQNRLAAAARAEAAARWQAKLAAGFNPDDSLIEKIRANLDLEALLLDHGYTRRGDKYRHPNSTSGEFGADIKNFGGIDRLYSHNANDPLHRDNLPDWCGVTAVDAFDVMVVLDYGGNRRKALRELAKRYGDTKNPGKKQSEEHRAVARLIFRLLRAQAPQKDIEDAALAEGRRQGLTDAQVDRTAHWVAEQALAGKRRV